jgi:ABC-type transporter Mla MlaB component
MWQEVGAVGLCQYDTRLFDPAACTAVGGAHTAVAQDDCTLPLATITPSRDPWGLRVDGELDVSNAAALGRALRARAAAGGSLAIDMANVGFVDLEAALVLYGVATELAAGEELRVRRAPSTLRRLVQIMGWDDPRLRVEGR